MKRIALIVSLIALTASLSLPSAWARKMHPADPPPSDHVVRIALLLDTSNSMDGLINQAKSHLWSVVNTFAAARHQGKSPGLRVALLEYGNNGLPSHQGYIRCVQPFTEDLDKISEALFSLTTNGGSEHCGQVIDTALTTLDWGPNHGAYKAIFIAGNEPFTQGPVNFQTPCTQARQRQIVVNTIHCGSYQQGLAGQWQAGAQLAGGVYHHIYQDRQIIDIPAPQDDDLVQLNRQLNETYLWFGQARQENARRQTRQDAAAQSMAQEAAVSRMRAKASAVYDNRSRDLVDAVNKAGMDLDEVEDEALPEPMQQMTPAERKAFVAKQAQRRAEIQQKILKLTAKREKFVAAKRKELAGDQGEQDTLGQAMVKSIRTQLAERGYKLAEARPATEAGEKE